MTVENILNYKTMKRSNFSVWPLVVLMSSLLKNGDPFTIVQHIYQFTKDDARLDCPFSGGPRIIWKESDVRETIAINGTIVSTNPKYNNFDVSIERNISSLIISRAEIEDDGIYSCHTPARKSLSFWLHMQNPPTLSISIDGILVNTSFDVDENTEVIVECNATGADPPVYVSLSLDDEPLALDEQIMNNDTHTAYSSSRLTVERSHREIVCIDSGQKLSMFKKTIYLNVNYKDRQGLSDRAIFAISIGVVVVLLVGFIGLCIFKHKELPVYAKTAIASGVVSLFGLIGLIISEQKKWPLVAIFLFAFGVGSLVVFIGSIIITGKEFSFGAIAAIDIVVVVALFLPVAFAVVVLLFGILQLYLDKHEKWKVCRIVSIAIGVVVLLVPSIASIKSTVTESSFDGMGTIYFVVVVNVGLLVAFEAVFVLVGYILLIIYQRKKWPVYGLVVIAIGVVVLLDPLIGFILTVYTELSLDVVAKTVVIVAFGLPFAFAVVGLLAGLRQWIIDKRGEQGEEQGGEQGEEQHAEEGREEGSEQSEEQGGEQGGEQGEEQIGLVILQPI